jgi:hypothetical protein
MFVYRIRRPHPALPGSFLCWYAAAGANINDVTAEKLAGPFGNIGECTAWIAATDPAHPLGVQWIC